jgi:hypothetical protein
MKKLILILFLSSACFGTAIESFTTGQVSPLMEGRTDFPKYQSASRTMENVFVWPQGPVSRRPGTEYIADVNGSYESCTGSDDYPTLQVADGTFSATTYSGLAKTTAISDVNDLNDIRNDLTGNYYLTQDINCANSATWNAGAGFEPIGSYSLTLDTEFSGTLDGCGYSITNLFMSTATVDVGLFGAVQDNGSDVVIANLTIEDCNIKGEEGVGPLVGACTATTDDVIIQNCHVTGTSYVIGISGARQLVRYFGGLIGEINAGSTGGNVIITDCNVNTIIDVENEHTETDPDTAGGFIGLINTGQGANDVNITNCRATGNVSCKGVGGTHGSLAGGFIGNAEEGATITDCAATGTVSADKWAGGFVGTSKNGQNWIGPDYVRCSARGNVTVTRSGQGVGGFCCEMSGTMTDCYSWGTVTAAANGYVGGLVQYGVGPLTITNCYDKGALSGPSGTGVGGIIQYPDNTADGNVTVANTFWDTTTTGEADAFGYNPDGVTGGAGHVTSWMQTQTNYTDAGWDFTTVWEMTQETCETIWPADLSSRLIAFEYSTDDSYVLALTDGCLHFFRTTE